MLTAADVTAIIVTRGDVDLDPCLETLPYSRVIIWDNRKRFTDLKCFGRWAAALEAPTEVVYFQDDDIVFDAHDELLAAYAPKRITCNMPDPWYTANQYDVLGQALVGAGALMPRHLALGALAHYLESYPWDDLFLTYCDFIVGQLVPHKRLDLGYRILPHASGPDRIYTQPGAHERKMTVLQRARQLHHLRALAQS
jgi:hypothetical protein